MSMVEIEEGIQLKLENLKLDMPIFQNQTPDENQAMPYCLWGVIPDSSYVDNYFGIKPGTPGMDFKFKIGVSIVNTDRAGEDYFYNKADELFQGLHISTFSAVNASGCQIWATRRGRGTPIFDDYHREAIMNEYLVFGTLQN
jgi:hypothetical protein